VRVRRQGAQARRTDVGEQLWVNRVAVVEQGYFVVGREHRAQPGLHAGHGGGELAGWGPVGGLQQVRYVDEVGEDLAVVGGRALVVAAVGQDLAG
jgi:hypothetical protein